MICALSVYSGDAAAAQRLLEWIAELGGVGSHSLVLATTQHVNPAPLLEVAQKSWGGVEQFTINMQQERLPWPVPANLSFQAVCNRLKDRGQPFFFLEADCVPIVGNWLDQLEREYHANAKPFMGVVHSMVNNMGEPVPNSLHMNGAGIYPAQVDRHLPSLPFLMTAMATEPWDIALRHEIMSRTNGLGGFLEDANKQRVSACHATDKICFCWRTHNYRIENGNLAYDVVGARHHLAQLDFWKHILHHGCKDGSIIEVLRKRINPSAVVVTKPAELMTEPTWTVANGSGHHHMVEKVNMVAEERKPVVAPAVVDAAAIADDAPLPVVSAKVMDAAEPNAPRKIAKLKGRRGRPPKNTLVDTVSK